MKFSGRPFFCPFFAFFARLHQRNTRGSSRSAFVSAQHGETTLELSPSFRNPPRDYDPKKTSFYETESSNYVKLLINALLGFLEGWPGWPGFARLERSSTSSAINPAAHTKAAPVRGRRPGRRDSGPTLSWSAPHRDSIPEPHLAQLCRPERGGSSLHRPSSLVTAETGGWPSERSRKAP